MAGLLAWAADVVTGNGVAGGQQEQEEQRSRVRRAIRFNADEHEEVRQLEARAAALQQTIQYLRLQIPPPDISRSLPQLHSESLAVHSSFSSELNAHHATQEEAQKREASLQSENAAYAKAVLSVQQQLNEKTRENFLLDERLQEMEKEESLLTLELDLLQSSMAAKEEARPSVLENRGRADSPLLLSTDKVMKEGEELQRTRAELKMWEFKLARLEKEWAVLLQNSARLPSAAQREKELERRLRNLSEQLGTKQVQADTLTKERNMLEFQLTQIYEIRRQASLNDTSGNAYKAKTGKMFPTASGTASDTLAEESKLFYPLPTLEIDQAKVAALKRAFRHTAERLRNIWGPSKTWISQMSIQLHPSSALRVLIMLYLLSLHIIAFAVISFAT